MCGGLRRENQWKFINNLVTVNSITGPKEVTWTGHARLENLDIIWDKYRPEKVDIITDRYTEKGVEFLVPAGHVIKGIISPGPDSMDKGLCILTRQATRAELERCSHPRHPLTGPPMPIKKDMVILRKKVV